MHDQRRAPLCPQSVHPCGAIIALSGPRADRVHSVRMENLDRLEDSRRFRGDISCALQQPFFDPLPRLYSMEPN